MVHEFTLIIDGDPDAPGNMDLLFEAGCNDATFGKIRGVALADFTREAPWYITAVVSAIRQIESVPGLRVSKIFANTKLDSTV